MQYRTDKISGNELSALGFGCMRLPKSIGSIDMKKAEEMVLRAIEAGVNYFDTAHVYPGSEETLGAIIEKNNLRDKIFIATKLPLIYTKTKDDFEKYFNLSLKRLKTDYIDYYLLHMITDFDHWTKLKSMGITNWIAEKKNSKQIGRIGFSYHGDLPEFLKVIDDYNWEMCLIQYNYSDENFQAGAAGLKKAAEKMPVMIMEPLLGGKLAAGLPKEAVEVFKKANPDLSPAAWALNWVWNQKEVTLLLSGMSDMQQLEENLKLADSSKIGMLSETELDTFQKALSVINRTAKINCTGCNYCIPCPKGINIPGCFTAYNLSYSMGFFEGLKQFLACTGFFSERSGSPSLCSKCGKCEKLCPQKIPIIKNLVKVRRRLEPFWIKFVGACARAYMGRKRKK